MSPELEALCATAYQIDQLQHNAPGATTLLRDAFAANPALAEEAAVEHTRIAAVVAARAVGGRHGDHVSAVFLTLLNAALGDTSPAEIASVAGGFSFVSDGAGGLSIRSPDGSLYPLVVPK